jgi:putative hemolysin
MCAQTSPISLSELKRRAKHSERAKAELKREQLLPQLQSLLKIKSSVLLALNGVLLISIFGWVLGIILVIIVAVVYTPLSAVGFVSRQADKLYKIIEPKYISLLINYPRVFTLLNAKGSQNSYQLHSKEEFQELIQHSNLALTDIERKLIVNALDFNDKKVTSIMTPKADIDFIHNDEFLGPLVLDELHELGHSRLPVVDTNLDTVVGILYLRDLLSLDIRKSSTAEKAMDTHVYYVREDQSLEHALAAFLKNRHHMFIVVNKHRETVGLLTIEDTIEALLGRRVIDEDDNHADLSSVAE